MPKLKQLSGKDIVKIFILFGFEVVSQKGSHIKMKREIEELGKEILTIPNHQELDKGTLKAIIRQACKYISQDILEEHFYHK